MRAYLFFRAPVVWFTVVAFLVPGLSGAPTEEQVLRYTMPPEISSPKISPDGAFVAVRARKGDAYGVGVYDLKTGKQRLIGGSSDVNVETFWWKTARRLIVRTERSDGKAEAYMAVNADGTDPVDLWQLQRLGRLIDPLVTEPDLVSVGTTEVLNRLNLKTGKVEVVEQSLNHVWDWFVDARGNARAARTMTVDGIVRVHWRAPDAPGWKTNVHSVAERDFWPMTVDRDPRYLWVADFKQGDSLAVSRFDTVTGERTVAVHRPGLDVTHFHGLGPAYPSALVQYTQLPSAPFVATRPEFEDGVARLQLAFRGFFITGLDAPLSGKPWVMRVGNARNPGTLVVFDPDTGKYDALGRTHGNTITDEMTVPADHLSVPDRSGRSMTGLLWRPRGVKQPPLVVYMAESMPQLPATNIYHDQVQALAASGFAVLMVNGRGTMGFGRAHMEAVASELDRALREDCEDMVAALAKEGVIDPKRVAVVGERMGGAMAVYLATTSKAFAAAININAPPEVSREDLLSFGVWRGLAELQRDLGGWRRASEIAAALSVEKNLKTCTVPTLHLYNDAPANKGTLNDLGRRVRRAAGDSEGRAQVAVAYSWTDEAKPATRRAREEAALVVRMVTFLEGAMAGR